MRTRMAAAAVAASLISTGASAGPLTQRGSVTLPGVADAGRVAAEGGYAYVASSTNQGAVLVVVDVSNPAAPREVSRLSGVQQSAVAVSGRYVYTFGGALTIVDVADPAAPVVVGSVPVAGVTGYAGLQLSGGYVYGANGAGLHVLDVSNPAAPVEVGTLALPSATSVAIADPGSTICTAEAYALVTSLDGSLYVVNVSVPSSPRFVSALALGWGEAWGVATAGRYAYAASFARSTDPENAGDPINGKLHVVDVSNPGTPVVVASRTQARACHDVALAGGYVYMVEESTDLNATYDDTSVVDVRTPTAPVEVSRTRTLRAWDLAVSGSYVYVPVNGYPASLNVYQAYVPATPGGI
jgi:hypothetical protein